MRTDMAIPLSWNFTKWTKWLIPVLVLTVFTNTVQPSQSFVQDSYFGDISPPGEVLLEVGETIVLNCTIRKKYRQTIQAKDLYFQSSRNGPLPNKYQHILSENSIQLRIPNATWQNGYINCLWNSTDLRARQILPPVIAVTVMYMPEPIEDLSCMSPGQKSMTCKWCLRKKNSYNLSVSNLAWSIGSSPSLSKCPHKKRIGSCYTCTWLEVDGYDSFNSVVTYRMTIETKNRLGDRFNSTAITNKDVDAFLIVKPEPVENVKVTFVNSSSFDIQWTPSKAPSIFRYQYLVSVTSNQKVLVQSYLSKEEFFMTGLLPHTTCEVRVSRILERGGFWSDNFTTHVTTSPSAPVQLTEDQIKLLVFDGSVDEVLLRWVPPNPANGPIDLYVINQTLSNATKVISSILPVSGGVTEHKVDVDCKVWKTMNVTFTVTSVNMHDGERMTSPPSPSLHRLLCVVAAQDGLLWTAGMTIVAVVVFIVVTSIPAIVWYNKKKKPGIDLPERLEPMTTIEGSENEPFLLNKDGTLAIFIDEKLSGSYASIRSLNDSYEEMNTDIDLLLRSGPTPPHLPPRIASQCPAEASSQPNLIIPIDTTDHSDIPNLIMQTDQDTDYERSIFHNPGPLINSGSSTELFGSESSSGRSTFEDSFIDSNPKRLITLDLQDKDGYDSVNGVGVSEAGDTYIETDISDTYEEMTPQLQVPLVLDNSSNGDMSSSSSIDFGSTPRLLMHDQASLSDKLPCVDTSSNNADYDHVRTARSESESDIDSRAGSPPLLSINNEVDDTRDTLSTPQPLEDTESSIPMAEREYDDLGYLLVRPSFEEKGPHLDSDQYDDINKERSRIENQITTEPSVTLLNEIGKDPLISDYSKVLTNCADSSNQANSLASPQTLLDSTPNGTILKDHTLNGINTLYHSDKSKHTQKIPNGIKTTGLARNIPDVIPDRDVTQN